jgi:ElaB/YqjD/DUF883 family membrane-anchored ribosome-binding protein
MQDTSIGTKMTKQLHNVTDTVREPLEKATSEVSSRAKTIAQDTVKTANKVYSQASTWLQQNYGSVIGVAGALLVGGVAGFFIGRSAKSSTTTVSS